MTIVPRPPARSDYVRPRLDDAQLRAAAASLASRTQRTRKRRRDAAAAMALLFLVGSSAVGAAVIGHRAGWWRAAPSDAVTPPPAAPLAPAVSAPEPTTAPPRALPHAPRTPHAPAETPEAIFRRAALARASGDYAVAARAFDELRRQHRKSRLAGVSAFELGRLRMDVEHDPRNAAAAFEDALRLGGGDLLRDDVEARLVEALDRAGDRPRCQAARARFLSAHPSSHRVAEVEARCRP